MPTLKHTPNPEQSRPLTLEDGEVLLARVDEIHAELSERIAINTETLTVLMGLIKDHAHDPITDGSLEP